MDVLLGLPFKGISGISAKNLQVSTLAKILGNSIKGPKSGVLIIPNRAKDVDRVHSC